MAERRIPLRKCIGCGEMKEKRQLLRVVRSKEGEISLDPVGKAPGRGAYLCKSAACFDLAKKSRRLERAFFAPVDEAVFEGLKSKIAETEEEQV